MKCRHCGSEKTCKNGVSKGYQRHKCKGCGRTFSGTPQKHDDEKKARAVQMVLNGVGVRKTAKLLGTNHVNVLAWLKKAHLKIDQPPGKSHPNYSEEADIIELDEIYTFVKKRGGESQCGQRIPEN